MFYIIRRGLATLNPHKTLEFKNNSASEGSVFYGGLLDRCVPVQAPHRIIIYQAFKYISDYKHTALAVSSKPLKVCFCINGSTPECSIRELNETKMRGETVNVTIVGGDQDEHPLKSIIKASYMQISAQLDKGEGRRELLNQCKELSYHVFTTDSVATLIFEPDSPCGKSHHHCAHHGDTMLKRI